MLFEEHLKSFLIIGGIVTMFASLYFFAPTFALNQINELPYDNHYLFIVRHWGVMVGVMGIMIVLSAYITSWREPIMLFSFIEKFGMVYLYIMNAFEQETAYLNAYFIPFAITDIIIVAYTICYWHEQRIKRKASFSTY